MMIAVGIFLMPTQIQKELSVKIALFFIFTCPPLQHNGYLFRQMATTDTPF